MGEPKVDFGRDDPGLCLIVELLRCGLALTDLLAGLLEEIPDDAFPGERSGDVLLEMVVGTCRPALEAAGEGDCRRATALIAAVTDRVFEDLRAAARLAGPD